MPGNELTASFRCIIPRSASVANPARPALYGHGLLGSNSEVHQGANKDMSNEHDIVSCATYWYGMSSEDVLNAIATLRDGSNMPTIADRLQQGMLAQLYLGRLMIAPGGLSSDPNFAGL